MIEKIHIQNFKSIFDLNIEVGRVNLFIGENGSGKSNILEALVFVSATKQSKVDNEFLFSRGLRVTNPNLMRSSFKTNTDDIVIEITFNGEAIKSAFYNDNKEYSSWMIDERLLNPTNDLVKTLNTMLESKRYNKKQYEELIDNLDSDKIKKIINLLSNVEKTSRLENFLIYSPENTALRTFEKEGQILPLGINGEGLLKLLKVINNYEDKTNIQEIIKALQLFNWFENIIIPDNTDEDNIIIKDKYLDQEFDQKSSNEGFLFILFYITLMVAKETPKIFAIDNIDASLNPKLCTKLMTILVDLSKKYDKQIFLTTHNPAILDGIDLNDIEQKLFIVSRKKQGHTRVKNITIDNKPKSSTNEPLKLSEAFLRGYLGGLPKGF